MHFHYLRNYLTVGLKHLQVVLLTYQRDVVSLVNFLGLSWNMNPAPDKPDPVVQTRTTISKPWRITV